MTEFQNVSAFTLIEIMVVVVIIATLASIALPRYQKIYHRSVLRDTRSQLITLHAGNEVYLAQAKEYFAPTEVCGTSSHLDDINNRLNISIIPSNAYVHYCYQPIGQGYQATATYAPPGYTAMTILLTDAPLGTNNPSCVENPDWGTCPW